VLQDGVDAKATSARAGSPAVATALVFAVGVGFAVQAFLNGRLSTSLGSAELAGTVNNVVGLAVLLAYGTITGVPARARRALPGAGRLRWWHLVAGVNGAFFIAVGAYAAPRVGIALLVVAVVCGQSTGSLLVDWLGLSPAGRRPFTPPRVLAAGLALVAVALGAVGSTAHARPLLLVLLLVAGAGTAIQQAALGHVTRATGEPVAAAAINFAVGTAALLLVALVVTGGDAPNGWSAPPAQWTAGVIGAACAVIMARFVSRLGVLRLMLLIVAGQSVGGLVLDVVAPPAGESLTVLSFVSVGLTLVAVAISASGARELRAPGGRSARRSSPPG
jgi:transporter family-2 protein